MAFDPYHKWLGIPPDQQPASHYRLLGITEFESDLEVIETAAERQTGFLRTFQTGPDAELASVQFLYPTSWCLARQTAGGLYGIAMHLTDAAEIGDQVR